MRPKKENCFSPNSSYYFNRTMVQVYKYGINLTLTVAMVTNIHAKIGRKKKIDHFGADLRRLTEKLT